jgi:uncharacterized membrane protein
VTETPIPENRTRTWACLLAILALAAVLRIASAGGFWIDEVFSAANAKAGPSTFVDRLQGEPHSPWPIYYLLLGLWMKVVPGVAGMKALSILISLATVLAMYGLGKSLHGPRAGWLAALLAAANPLLAWYGGEIRMYALMLLCLTGVMWATIRALRFQRARDGLLFALFASLCVYSHVFAVFPVLVLTVVLLVRTGGSVLWPMISLAGVAAVPAVALGWDQVEHWLSWKGAVASGYVSSPLSLLAAAQAFFTAYALPLMDLDPMRVVAAALLAALVGVPVVTAIRRGASAGWILVVLVVVGLAAPWVLQMRTLMYSPRFALCALPPLILLIAAGTAVLNRWTAGAVTAGLVLVGIASVMWGAGRTDWREVDDILRDERRIEDRLVFEGGNVIALQEWFGDPFLGGPMPRTGLGIEAEWYIVFRRETRDSIPNMRVRPVGPERRLLEDERPWILSPKRRD